MDKRGKTKNRNALGYHEDGYEVGPHGWVDRQRDFMRATGIIVSWPIPISEMS